MKQNIQSARIAGAGVGCRRSMASHNFSSGKRLCALPARPMVGLHSGRPRHHRLCTVAQRPLWQQRSLFVLWWSAHTSQRGIGPISLPQSPIIDRCFALLRVSLLTRTQGQYCAQVVPSSLRGQYFVEPISFLLTVA